MNRAKKKYFNIGEVVRRTLVDSNKNPILDEEGNEIQVNEIKLKQNVDLMVDGEVLTFSSYELKNGTKLFDKVLRLSPIDTELARLDAAVEKGSLNEDLASKIKEKHEKQNTSQVVTAVIPE